MSIEYPDQELAGAVLFAGALESRGMHCPDVRIVRIQCEGTTSESRRLPDPPGLEKQLGCGKQLRSRGSGVGEQSFPK